ncbi:MAG: septum formation protein Maf [Chloroflexi bacterium]|jgi:MAF protein|nr:septum formation protein Maf [Chloroflexota bacterium]MBT5476176.1 septum formation protein Maf [Chloroflexota bacterium]MBT7466802.1 septum formation protein Maf [Chloroflexota bacterium]MBT7833596.1 septum formation protein Maf [Chloroflexota bacterium]
MVSSSVTKLVLASGSPRRAEILSESGFDLKIIPASVDEDAILTQGSDLVSAVRALALAKASYVAGSNVGEFVLGADTIVVFENEVFGKPESSEQACEMLNRLSGRQHKVITGVAIVNPVGQSHTKFVSTSVVFRNLEDDEISKYVSSDLSLDKAGGYGIQDSSFAPVASYDECYLNVVGLPMCATSDLLEKSGFEIGESLACTGHSVPRVFHDMESL